MTHVAIVSNGKIGTGYGIEYRRACKCPSRAPHPMSVSTHHSRHLKVDEVRLNGAFAYETDFSICCGTAVDLDYPGQIHAGQRDSVAAPGAVIVVALQRHDWNA